MDQELISTTCARYPLRGGRPHEYGTAGFRENADGLDGVFFAVGLLAVLRSKKVNGQTIGVMITASHNPEQDNGVKLVDPQGDMMVSSWESHATALANSSDLIVTLKSIVDSENIDLLERAQVIYAHDTRASGPRLIKALTDGLSCFASTLEVIEGGLKTTPQLHYLVKCLNDGGVYGVSTEEGYYQKLSVAFTAVNEGNVAKSSLMVDCANGVGAPKLELFKEYLSETFLNLELISTDVHSAGKLNKGCGADYVKTNQCAPSGISLEPYQRACSFDGDADRVVYYYISDSGFRLMDGDKIATLVAGYIKELVCLEDLSLRESIKIGVVQTAYANGNSTRYITETLSLPVLCTPTGVKHLHHAAQSFDVGIYFEANGHGTVLFSKDLLARLPSSSKLLQLAGLINQTVGDSISDMLLVETILHQRKLRIEEWDKAYEELPNRLVKVLVNDRKSFVTEDAERKLVEPKDMQAKLNGIVSQYQSGRAFVRPSGTEDCVRVYAEAATREMTDELAFKVAGMVFNFSGKGDKPTEFI